MDFEDPEVIKKRLLENLARKRQNQLSKEAVEDKSNNQYLNKDENNVPEDNITTVVDNDKKVKENDVEEVKAEQVESPNKDNISTQEDDQTSLEEGEIVDDDNNEEEENIRQNINKNQYTDDINKSSHYNYRRKVRRKYPRQMINQPVSAYHTDPNYMSQYKNFNPIIPQVPINYFPQEFPTYNPPPQINNFGFYNIGSGYQHMLYNNMIPPHDQYPMYNYLPPQNKQPQESIEHYQNQPYRHERMSEESEESNAISQNVTTKDVDETEIPDNNPVDNNLVAIEEENETEKALFNKYQLVIDVSESDEEASDSNTEASSKSKDSKSKSDNMVVENDKKRKIDQISKTNSDNEVSMTKKTNVEDESIKKAQTQANIDLINGIKESIQKRKLELNDLYENQEKLKYKLIAYQKSLKKISLERHELEVKLGIIKEFLNQTNYKLKTLRSKEYESNKYITFTENQIKRIEKMMQNTQNILDSEIRSLSRLEIDTELKKELINFANMPLISDIESEKLKNEVIKQQNRLKLEIELLKDAHKLISEHIRKLNSIIIEKIGDINSYIEKYSNVWIKFHKMFSKEYVELRMPSSSIKAFNIIHDLAHSRVDERSIVAFLKSYRLYKGFNGKFSSLTWSNKIDPFKILCRYESNGMCNDDSCQLQHKRQYTMSEKEILDELSSYAPDKTNPKKQEFVKGVILQKLEKGFSNLDFEDKSKKLVEMLRESYKDEIEESPIFFLFNEKKSSEKSLKRKKKTQSQKSKESTNVDVSVSEESENFIPFTGSLNIVVDQVSDSRYFVEKEDKDESSSDLSYEELLSLQNTTDEMWLRLCFKELGNLIKDPKSFKPIKYINNNAKEKILNMVQQGIQRHIDSVILWYIYLYLLFLKRKSGKSLSEIEINSIHLAPYSPSLLEISSKLYVDINQRINYLNSMLDHLNLGERSESKDYGFFCIYLELLSYKLEIENIEQIEQWIDQHIMPIQSNLSGMYRVLINLSYIYLIHCNELPFQTIKNLALQSYQTPILFWRKSNMCDKVVQLFEKTLELFDVNSKEKFILLMNYFEFARINNISLNLNYSFEDSPILPCMDCSNVLIRSLEDKDHIFNHYFQKSYDFMYIYCKLKCLLTSDNNINRIIDQFYSILWEGFKSLYEIEITSHDDMSDIVESIFLRILSLSHFRGIHPYTGALTSKELMNNHDTMDDQYSSYRYKVLPLNESNPFMWLSFYVYSLIARYQQSSYQVDIIKHAHYYLHNNKDSYKIFWKEIIEWNTVINYSYARTNSLELNSSFSTFNLYLENFDLTLYISQLELKMELPHLSTDIYQMLNILKAKDYDFLNHIFSHILTYIEKNKHIELCEQLYQYYPDNYELTYYLSRLEYDIDQEYSYVNSKKILRNAIRNYSNRNSDLWIELLRSESKIGSIETLVSIAKEATENAPFSHKLKFIYKALQTYEEKLKDL